MPLRISTNIENIFATDMDARGEKLASKLAELLK